MLRLFTYGTVTVVHFTDQRKLFKTAYYIRSVKLILQTETQNRTSACVHGRYLLY